MPKAPPIIPASINAVSNMVDGKSLGESKPVLVVALPSRARPQKRPAMIIRIELTSEVIAIPS
jgi:hypothetical protein